MMDTIHLTAAPRTEVKKQVRNLRKQGKIPAVLYGHGIATTHVQLDAGAFAKALQKAGEATLIDLAVGSSAPVKVLVHDVQHHPVTGDVLHVDLYQVRMDEKIQTEIPFEFVGESPAVKQEGGILVKNHAAVKIEALPGDLVPHLVVDITALANINDALKLKDLAIPKGIQPLMEPEEVIVVVSPPRSEAELKELEQAITEDVSAVGEAVEKKPEEGAEAEGEQAAAGSAPEVSTEKK